MIGKEPLAFLPGKLEVGKTRKIPEPITRRLARFNLLDNVLGASLPFEATQIEAAELVSKITGIEGDLVRLSLRGSTRARAKDRRLKRADFESARAQVVDWGSPAKPKTSDRICM